MSWLEKWGRGSRAHEGGPALAVGDCAPAPRPRVGRTTVWREVLATEWLALAVAIAAAATAAARSGWRLPEPARLVDPRWASLCAVLACLLAGALEGAFRAVGRRERKLAEKRQELERLVRTPQRRVAEAKYQLHRDALVCTQLVGYLTASRIEAGAMTPEAVLGIEQSWGSAFLERFRGMFGAGTYGDVVSQRIGGSFPPPREQAIAVYVGLADFLHFLAERITERDLDPAYLHGDGAAPEPRPARVAPADETPSAEPAG